MGLVVDQEIATLVRLRTEQPDMELGLLGHRVKGIEHDERALFFRGEVRSLVSIVSSVFHVFTLGGAIAQLSAIAMLGYTISANNVHCQTAVELIGGKGRFPLSLR